MPSSVIKLSTMIQNPSMSRLPTTSLLSPKNEKNIKLLMASLESVAKREAILKCLSICQRENFSMSPTIFSDSSADPVGHFQRLSDIARKKQ